MELRLNTGIFDGVFLSVAGHLFSFARNKIMIETKIGIKILKELINLSIH